ncbi:response regulator transcription factor [Alloprevotella rava]|uniref:Transcriptional regulatory protein rprY n=2 Tax=Alloprevotella rava TaxID=671218 RepID=G5G938_9BACT|nr:response regulator transcription factor [Alloprevotella rava]EHG24823.1 transcriptional regulatory protein rprY [Alloprevotella rava F0323]MBB3703558.1 DNA-binding response OmpR family regulator [Alloprevotella rava]
MDEKNRIRILLCEDEENLGPLLREYLQAKGFDTELAVDGEEGYKTFMAEKFDLCILDVMMPKKDGFTLAKEIRSVNEFIPIIFLTAKTLKEDIQTGFKIGADDYVTKPFSMEELRLRIEAVMRRVSNKQNRALSFYKIGSYEFDTKKQTLSRGGKIQDLTTKESELLNLLCAHANDVLLRDDALKAIWLDNNYFNARSMDVYITRLRKHLQEDENVRIINVHGKGYRLIMPDGE